MVVVVDGVVDVVVLGVVVVAGAEAAGAVDVVVGGVVVVSVVMVPVDDEVVVLDEVVDCDVDESVVVVDGVAVVVEGFVDSAIGAIIIRCAAASAPDTRAGESGVHDVCCCQDVTFSWGKADEQYVELMVELWVDQLM